MYIAEFEAVLRRNLNPSAILQLAYATHPFPIVSVLDLNKQRYGKDENTIATARGHEVDTVRDALVVNLGWYNGEVPRYDSNGLFIDETDAHLNDGKWGWKESPHRGWQHSIGSV